MIRIAVCEDNLDELQTQKKMVQSIMLELSKNTEIFGFQNGEDLLFEMDVSGDMNIIFLDVELSGINGIETAQMIRKRDVRAALIFVSCHNQYYREMIEVQPYAFLDKPVSAERCTQTFKAAFRNTSEPVRLLYFFIPEKTIQHSPDAHSPVSK